MRYNLLALDVPVNVVANEFQQELLSHTAAAKAIAQAIVSHWGVPHATNIQAALRGVIAVLRITPHCVNTHRSPRHEVV
jgi:hypothetical protein